MRSVLDGERMKSTLAAFDLIELQGDDLRDEPLSKRKQRLAKILESGPDAIVYNEHLEQDGAAVFEHACRMGLEGIVSKRLELALSERAVQDLAEVEKFRSVTPCGASARKTGPRENDYPRLRTIE